MPPSFRIRNDSTDSGKSCQQCHVLIPSWLPRSSSLQCPPGCLVSLCRSVFQHSSYLALGVVSLPQPWYVCDSSLNSFVFLKVFLDFPPPLSLDSVFLLANASNVLYIISQVFAHVMTSGFILVCGPNRLVSLLSLTLLPL